MTLPPFGYTHSEWGDDMKASALASCFVVGVLGLLLTHWWHTDRTVPAAPRETPGNARAARFDSIYRMQRDDGAIGWSAGAADADLVAALERANPAPAGQREFALDLGCGLGHDALFLSTKFSEGVACTDFSAAALARARSRIQVAAANASARAAPISFVQADFAVPGALLAALGHTHGTLDLVWVRSVLRHLGHVGARVALDAVHTLLRPRSGRLMLKEVALNSSLMMPRAAAGFARGSVGVGEAAAGGDLDIPALRGLLAEAFDCACSVSTLVTKGGATTAPSAVAQDKRRAQQEARIRTPGLRPALLCECNPK